MNASQRTSAEQNCSKYQLKTAVRKPQGFWSRQHRRWQSASANLPPALQARGGPRDPLASLTEEDDNKVCLPAKRQRSSTLGIGTVCTPFGSLQVKVRRQSADTAHFDGQSSPCLRDYWQTGQWSHKSRFSKVRVSRLGIMSLFRRCCETIRWRHELFFDVGDLQIKVKPENE